MRITVQLQPPEALCLRDVRDPDASAECSVRVRELLELLLSWDATIAPLHPSGSDRELMTFFEVTLTDNDRLEEVRTALLELRCVDAAYVKPPDEAP